MDHITLTPATGEEELNDSANALLLAGANFEWLISSVWRAACSPAIPLLKAVASAALQMEWPASL